MAARSYRAARTIDAPAVVVWGLLTDVDSYADWNSAVISGRSEFTMVEEFTGPLAGLIARAIPDLTDSFDTFVADLRKAAEAKRIE